MLILTKVKMANDKSLFGHQGTAEDRRGPDCLVFPLLSRVLHQEAESSTGTVSRELQGKWHLNPSFTRAGVCLFMLALFFDPNSHDSLSEGELLQHLVVHCYVCGKLQRQPLRVRNELF